MPGEWQTLLQYMSNQHDAQHVEIMGKLHQMNDWMHEIKGGLKVASAALGLIIALLVKGLAG